VDGRAACRDPPEIPAHLATDQPESDISKIVKKRFQCEEIVKFPNSARAPSASGYGTDGVACERPYIVLAGDTDLATLRRRMAW
jgi:hypothetical protein